MPTSESFEELRPYLYSIAYRMLGTHADAEDILQEAYVRWQGRGGADVETPKAFLTAVVTRLCIDQLRTARRRREEYIGPWLPEPLVTYPDDPMLESSALAESLSTVKKAPPELEIRFTSINGQLGLVTEFQQRTLTVMSIHVDEGRIRAVYMVSNPDKLAGLPPFDADD